MVRGLPLSTSEILLPSNISVFNHLPASMLQQKIEEAEYLVSRSGYSTLMDAYTLQKKCIFIPTPGQTEQEYLGRLVSERKMALVYRQESFSLENALESAATFAFHFPLNTMNDLLDLAVTNMLVLLGSK